jgi:cation diffusion facilitator family transporter
MTDHEARRRARSRKSKAAFTSVVSNSLLVAMKLVIGLASGSVSIISEAIHSANDLLAALIAFVSVRISDKPPDDEHPYGHGKAESISGAIEAALILVAAVWIIYEAVKRILSGGEVAHIGLGTLVMAISALINVFVSRYLFRVAREEDSLALETDAQHLATDVYTSIGVTIGLALVWITGWHLLDPIIAILVAFLILQIGWKLTVSAGTHLMDNALPGSEVAVIEGIIRSDQRVLSWHDLRTRKAGSQRHIDMHIVIAAESSLIDAHNIADDLELKIAEVLTPARVVVHVDPYDPEHDQPGATPIR